MSVVTAHVRYLKYWLNFAKTHQIHWPTVELEYDQLRRAWDTLNGETALPISPEARAQMVIDYLVVLDTFLERRSLLTENIAWLMHGLEAAQSLGKPFLLGRFGQDIGWCYRGLGQQQKALEFLNLALGIRRKYGPRIGEAATLNMLGVVYDDLAQHEQAIELFTQALAIRQEVRHR